MELRLESALKVPEFLMQINAIKLNISNPYTWASGWKSPIYCDNRRTLSFPPIRNYIRQEFVKLVRDEFIAPDVVAGVATGGIPHGVLVAERLGLPFVYVRPGKKSHGLGNQIEGAIEKGQRVVVIEDLVSTGKSSLNAVEALREAGCMVIGMAAIFTYNFIKAKKNFEDHNCRLITLSDYNSLIKVALQNGYIKESDVEILERWRDNPEEWGKETL
jgi:orotate phosphoribosyltransferase